MKQFAIYDPYLNILGGAERYILSIALCLEKEYEVTIFSEDSGILNRAAKKFGLQFKNYRLFPWSDQRTLRNANLKNLDLFLYVTDGSLFFSKAKKNILLIQTPGHIPQNNLVNQIKFLSWPKIICYSQFMADIIKKRINRPAEILFVPISLPDKTQVNKENMILSVGRFFPQLHSKKQMEMVSMFKDMLQAGLKNTGMFIAGSVDPGADSYYEQIKHAAEKLPVKIITDLSYAGLSGLYRKAKIYWHAAGFGEDLNKYPEKAEHFGVSTLEAMSFGCVPVVFAGGGQTEIVKNGVNGFTWKTKEELISRTQELLRNDNLRLKLSREAIKSAKNYSMDNFGQRLKTIINNK